MRYTFICSLLTFSLLTACSGKIVGSKSDHPDGRNGDDGGSSDNPFDNPSNDAGRTATGEPTDYAGCTYVPFDFEFGEWVCPDGGTAGNGGVGGSAGNGGAGGVGGNDADSGTPDGGDEYVMLCYFPSEGEPYEVHVKASDVAMDPDSYGECPDAPDGGTAGNGGSGGSSGEGGVGGAGGVGGQGGSGGTGGEDPPTCDHDPKKVVICHFPPGNIPNAHTIHVGAASVDAHITQHGDHVGPCTQEELHNSQHQ